MRLRLDLLSQLTGQDILEEVLAEQSPLQTRAAFLANWDWELVVSLNRGACERGRAQHGLNSETHATVAAEWERFRRRELTLTETLEFLRSCHRGAPYLFFNGNTFADIGRRLMVALLADLPAGRLREAASAAAHFIAGVLDRESMVQIIAQMCAAADLTPGTRVTTLRGSVRGTVVRTLEDGQAGLADRRPAQNRPRCRRR